MGLEVPETHVMIYFHAISSSLTVLLMIASEIYVRFSQHGSQSISTNVSTTIINTVPFLTLNISITLTVFFGIIVNIFGVSLVNTEPTMVLVAMLATNKMARKHLRLRFRQYMDSITIGRTNRVEPVIAVALVPIREIRKEQLWKWKYSFLANVSVKWWSINQSQNTYPIIVHSIQSSDDQLIRVRIHVQINIIYSLWNLLLWLFFDIMNG